MINCLEEKVLGLAEKVDKVSSLVERQEQYSRRNYILNKIKCEMDLDISPGDIDHTNRIGVPSKGENRPIRYVRYMDSMREFTNN